MEKFEPNSSVLESSSESISSELAHGDNCPVYWSIVNGGQPIWLNGVEPNICVAGTDGTCCVVGICGWIGSPGINRPATVGGTSLELFSKWLWPDELFVGRLGLKPGIVWKSLGSVPGKKSLLPKNAGGFVNWS